MIIKQTLVLELCDCLIQTGPSLYEIFVQNIQTVSGLYEIFKQTIQSDCSLYEIFIQTIQTVPGLYAMLTLTIQTGPSLHRISHTIRKQEKQIDDKALVGTVGLCGLQKYLIQAIQTALSLYGKSDTI